MARETLGAPPVQVRHQRVPESGSAENLESLSYGAMRIEESLVAMVKQPLRPRDSGRLVRNRRVWHDRYPKAAIG